MKNPYHELADTAFWRKGVVEKSFLDTRGLYEPKWKLSKSDKILTIGSCFAQHVAKYLGEKGYAVIDKERAPAGLPESEHKRFGYAMYSARYGNVYTARQLLQLFKAAITEDVNSEAAWLLNESERYIDGFRPNVEPLGLDSVEEVFVHRAWHLSKVKEALLECDVIVLTLGLTEGWVSNETGNVFPTAPGVIGYPELNSNVGFKNFNIFEVIQDLKEVIELLKNAKQQEFRMLLTVSPVALTATYAGKHILVANTHSKATLRAAAGYLSEEYANVDYFPSFEIVTSPRNHYSLYESNLRTVSDEAVQLVMRAFEDSHLEKTGASDITQLNNDFMPSESVCEEEILESVKSEK